MNPLKEALNKTSASLFDVEVRADSVAALIGVASDQLGEEVPYDDKTKQGIDRLDAVLRGAAALMVELRAAIDHSNDCVRSWQNEPKR